MKQSLAILFTVLLPFVSVACAAQPEVIVVEITRLVPQIEEVEVTRIVEVEKEVTRVVEAAVEGAAATADAAPADRSAVSEFESLYIDFWPDYDRPAILTLLTGELPADTQLPARITIPIPAEAEVNAVAEIDQNGMASIAFQQLEGAVLFDSSSRRFRVEYYAPYQRAGSRRDYDFAWQAPVAISNLAVQIQRPANAMELASDPPASDIVTEPSDGLDYYRLPLQSLPENTQFRLRFSYDMASDGLTADEPGARPELPGNPLHDQQAGCCSERSAGHVRAGYRPAAHTALAGFLWRP